jgi:hypothetical protein
MSRRLGRSTSRWTIGELADRLPHALHGRRPFRRFRESSSPTQTSSQTTGLAPLKIAVAALAAARGDQTRFQVLSEGEIASATARAPPGPNGRSESKHAAVAC